VTRLTEDEREFAEKRIDSVLEVLIPRHTKEEVMAFLDERYEEMFQLYQDFLSMPDS
jgi:hypothetical protein